MSSYTTTSTLTGASDERRLELATALAVTPTGWVENPVFFTGFLTRPDVASSGILAVADVAAARYDRLRDQMRRLNLDPVVTGGGDRLRFEAFSLCNGVYARLDLLDEGLETGEVRFGTTNVDVNHPLRVALARIDRYEPLHLSVGPDELRAATLSGTHVERKVDLPERWVRGLAEVPATTQSMRPLGELAGPAVSRFLGSLPTGPVPGPHLHVLPAPGRWRLSGVALPGSVPLPGAARLSSSRRILRHVRALTAYSAENGCSAWVFDLPGARFTLALSPDPARGFSGEGTLLTLLARSRAEVHGRRLLTDLGWSPVVDREALRQTTGLSPGEVDAGLAWLSASGRLGYDLAERAWFHRELPVDSEKVLRRNPRLTSAQTLVESGAVTRETASWTVAGSGGDTYRVTQDEDASGGPARLRCECAWEAEHHGSRGPCKHALAVVLSLSTSV